MKRIIFCLMLLLAFVVKAQTLYVVSVGIADYKDPETKDLRFTEADVKSFNNVMLKHTDQVYTLVGANATHTNVYNKINQVFSMAKAGDAVVLFFSGHGYPGGFCCYDMTDNAGGLSYNEIAALFKGCKASRKMVFADACFSGGLRKQKQGDNNSTNSVRKGDVMFFLSSRTNETSQEMFNGPNGQFTRFLVRGLGGGADKNSDRIITAKELYDFVHDGVVAATGKKQHPVMWGNFNNTMTVLNWKNR